MSEATIPSTEDTSVSDPGTEILAFEQVVENTSADAELAWADGLAREAIESECLTVGVMSGGNTANDPRSVDRMLQSLAARLQANRPGARLLALRCIDAESATEDTDEPNRIPVAKRSPLGPYCEVELIAVERKRIASALSQLPNWLAEWKDAFQLILVDIGSIDSVSAKAVGRVCDGCYLLLGPQSCGSQEWIMQQVAWHNRSGSTICGTIVAELKAA